MNFYCERTNDQFFNEPIGDTVLINNALGEGYMYFPFRITNTWTGKKVGLYCNDFGSSDASPVDFNWMQHDPDLNGIHEYAGFQRLVSDLGIG